LNERFDKRKDKHRIAIRTFLGYEHRVRRRIATLLVSESVDDDVVLVFVIAASQKKE